MGKIVWLASYPKAGNTWMRILLSNYRADSHKPIDINRIDSSIIASDRGWFDEWAGIKSSALDEATIRRLRPHVYRCLAREAEDLLFVKVHDGCYPLDDGRMPFPPEITQGVVYIVRNPLDMVASQANHYGISLDQAEENMGDSAFQTARSEGRLHAQLSQFQGSWSEHVEGWVDRSGLPVHVVRYEDLRRDTESVFGEVLAFCGLPVETERLRRAVAFSDFAELRRQERTGGFSERLEVSSDQFFRQGRSGGWRTELPEAMARRMIDRHGPMMRRFGYLDDAGHPL